MSQIDPVDVAIISARLSSICKEMDETMLRTSRSPIFSEARDFTTAIFDHNTELVAQTLSFATAEILDATERRVRADIAAIPDGEYYAERGIDHDGIEFDKSPVVRLTLKITGDNVTFDYTGSAAPRPSCATCATDWFPSPRPGINTPWSYLTTAPHWATALRRMRPRNCATPRPDFEMTWRNFS